MKAFAVALFACGACFEAAVTSHPVQGAIDTIVTLQKQAEEHEFAEAQLFAKHSTWCGNQVKTLKAFITKAKATIEEKKSCVEANKASKAAYTAEAERLGEEIKKMTASFTQAHTIRGEANKLFLANQKDLNEAITAIENAITAIQSAKSAVSMAQVRKQMQRLTSMSAVLVQLTDAQMAILANPGDKDDHVQQYDFKSGGVIELLKHLLQSFKSKLTDTIGAETNSQNAADLQFKDFNTMLRATQASAADATDEAVTAGTAQDKCFAQLTTETANLGTDEQSLSDTTTACDIKSSEWEERSKRRKDEIVAMKEAIELLSKFAGINMEKPNNAALPPVPPAEVVPPALVQAPGAAASSTFSLLAQEDPKQQAVTLLKRTAKMDHSQAMQRLAQEVEASLSASPHFDQVKNMIQKMVFRLQAEQTDEDKHKNWCDSELDKTSQSNKDKLAQESELSNRKDLLVAQSKKLADEIAAANRRISDLTTTKGEAEEIRAEGKEQNKLALADAAQCQEGVTAAIGVLTKHYKGTGAIAKESWELVQTKGKARQAPTTWNSEYTGTTGGAGVIGVLEKVLADCSSLEAETKASEQEDAAEFQKLLSDIQIEDSAQNKVVEVKSTEKTTKESSLAETNKEIKRIKDMLEKIDTYMTDLHEPCVEGDSTYKDRKQKRDDEITALKQSLDILANAFNAPSFVQVAFLAPVREH